MDKNRQSIRLKDYDYSKSGLYFVTICTENRECLLGNIVGANHDSPVPKMILNDIGKIVNDVLLTIPKRFDNVELDEFVIMPNHMHLILIIRAPVRVIHESPHRRFTQRGDKRQLLPQCIGYLKMNSSKKINQYVRAHHDAPQQAPQSQKIFQRNYYEHIIRTENDLNKIREYIINNPLMWDRDRNNLLYN